MTKSRLAFTIFNSLLLGLLLIHFAASHFYEPISDQPPNMVFPALFATGRITQNGFQTVAGQMALSVNQLSSLGALANQKANLKYQFEISS